MISLFSALAALAVTGTPGDAPDSIDARICAATVRLVVRDSRGMVYGSGTICEASGGDGLIVTCGHSFELVKPGVSVKVTRFSPAGEEDLTGELISFDMDNDVGLVAVRGLHDVTPIPLAPPGYTTRVGQRVVAAGCDDGRPASARVTSITCVGRYFGAPNVEVAAMPEHGRSGGGLFNERLELIGVCDAQVPGRQEGIYAALSSVYQQIAASRGKPDGEKLSALRRPAAENLTTFATAPSMMPVAKERGTATEGTVQPSTEIVCIVRSTRDPASASRVIVLNNVSGEFLKALEKERAARQAALR